MPVISGLQIAKLFFSYFYVMGKRPSIRPGKNILLKNVPPDVQSIIIDKINADSEDCQCIRNQEHSMFKIIREWKAATGNQLVVIHDGHSFVPSDYGVVFVGSEVELTIRVPITSTLGSSLNYKRLDK